MGLKAYLRLARVPAAGFTASVGLWGYLAGAHGVGADLGAALFSTHAALLLLIGGGAHVFGSVHNEVCDRDIDAHATYDAGKPLLSGEIGIATARRLAACAAAVGLALSALLAAWSSWPVLGLMVVSIAFAATYNAVGKRRFGAELAYAASLVTFALGGAAAAGGWAVIASPSVAAVALAGFLIMLSNSSFVGGLKDLESDEAAGMRTFSGALLRAGRRHGRPYAPLNAIETTTQLGAFAIVAYGIAFVFVREAAFSALSIAGVAGLAAGRVILFARAVAAPKRSRRLGLLAGHEFLAVLFFPILFADTLPLVWAIALVLFPLAGYLVANRLLYGTIAAPKV